MYAGGAATDDADVVVYDLCSTFHCLPSELDAEDQGVLERLAYIHYVVQGKIASRLKGGANAGN